MHAKVETQLRYVLRASRGAAAVRMACQPHIERIRESLRKIATVLSDESLLGLEGMAAKAYFAAVPMLLVTQVPAEMRPSGRTKHPPRDRFNALLSFGYALLTSKVASAVQLVGFDHFIGYLHSSFYGRPSLALDLVEEFRPIIVDSVVLNMLNHRMFSTDDFVIELGAYRLKQERRNVFFTKLEERLNEEVHHPLFGYQTTTGAALNSKRGS